MDVFQNICENNVTNDLFWYKQYALFYNLDKNINIDNYLEKLKNKSNEKNMQNKIIQIEQDYIQKIHNIEKLYLDDNKIKILKKQNSLIILQKELETIKILTKYTLQNKILNYKFLKICLNLLLEFSETLRLRLKQKEFFHDNIENKINISRCSYKFCSYQANCSYNYNSKSKRLCYQDHYVHNMVSADLKILLKYIVEKKKSIIPISSELILAENLSFQSIKIEEKSNEINYTPIKHSFLENYSGENILENNIDEKNHNYETSCENNLPELSNSKEFDNSMSKQFKDFMFPEHKLDTFIVHTKEILKTINTLSFVINHMECELRTKCLTLLSQSISDNTNINTLFANIPDYKIEMFHIVKN